jgi:peptidoglycan/LPS O-acetylase OafA/YrhL
MVRARNVQQGIEGLRAIAALSIAVFHFVCYWVGHVRNQEALTTPTEWGIASLYAVVDLFLALTGFLTALPLLEAAKAAEEKKEGAEYEVPVDPAPTRRFWRINLPYFIVIAVFLLVFWDDQSWPRGYTRSETLHHISELFGPGLPYQSASMGLLWTHLVHLNSIVPYGGPLIHTWSLGLQYLFWVLFPIAWRWFRLHRRRSMAIFMVASTVLMVLVRGLMWYRLQAFGGATSMSGYLHWSFYASFLARFYPMVAGVGVAWLVVHEPSLARVLAQPWPAKLTGTCLIVAVFASNACWEHTVGHPEENAGWHQLAFYLLGKPGGLLSSLGFAWLVLLVCIDHEGLFTQAMSAPAWRPISSASYWLYLIHPLVFILSLSNPHFLLPKSELLLPVPQGYGLRVPRQAYSIQNVSHPLSPWSNPSVQAVTDASAQRGFIPPEQRHWTLSRAPETQPVPRGVLAADLWLGILVGTSLSLLLAMAMEACIERPFHSAYQRLPPWARSAVEALISWYQLALSALLPLAHLAINIAWLTAFTPQMEADLLPTVKHDALQRGLDHQTTLEADRVRFYGVA